MGVPAFYNQFLPLNKSKGCWKVIYLLLLCMKHVLHRSWSISLERSYRSSHTLAGKLEGEGWVSDEPPPAGRNMKRSSVSTVQLQCFYSPSHVSSSQSNPINQATSFCSEETIPGHYDPNAVFRDIKLNTLTQRYQLQPPHLYFSSSTLEAVIATH
jgi:hypothetical protein